MPDSIHNSGNWQTVDEIVIPSAAQEPLVPYGMPTPKVAKPATYKAWQPAKDSIAKAKEDSIVRATNDSLAHIQSNFGLVLEAPYATKLQQTDAAPQSSADGLSWIFAALGVLFCIVCIKLKNAPGYLRTLIADAKEVRMRHNMFDNTVKETSFLFILLIGWVCCTGVLLWTLVRHAGGVPFVTQSTPLPDHTLVGVGICTAVAAAYLIFMLLSYELAGHVFADSRVTRLWVKGATAGMGLQTFVLFPLALLALCYPDWCVILLWIGAGILILGKILFIYKGFRIFFQQIRSCLLFLCYLCSLEIVPLILAYLLAYQICVKWL